jgi:RNA polymerase sigma-70 factor (ECF subfamily)
VALPCKILVFDATLFRFTPRLSLCEAHTTPNRDPYNPARLFGGTGRVTGDPYEARLIKRFQTGDVRAMEALLDRYADRALGLAVRLTETREDAEEVAQEAFVRAFRFARSFRGERPGGFGAWLFAIVRSVAADHRRQLRLPVVSLFAPEAEHLPAQNELPEVAAERQGERMALLSALEGLPEEWRTVLTLCDLEDVPHSEAAQVLGKSVAATKSLLYRARRGLRDRFIVEWSQEEV